MERTDRELLDRYIAHRDDAAFRELVKRHLPLVHGVARRVTCGDDLARDVSQEAFLRLARRAALIPAHVSLTAWLHRVTRLLAIDQMRSEMRRRKREMAAISSHESTMPAGASEPGWDALSPVIDQLVDTLPAPDREMLLARFYRNEPHAAIAQRLGLSETLTRKRTSRALEKLRALLGKKGIATSSSALAALLPAHAATPVPPLLMTSIAGAAAGVAPLAHGSIPSLFLTMDLAQKSLVAGALLLFLASLGYSITAPPSVASSSPSGAASSPSRVASPSRRTRTVQSSADLNHLREILEIPNAADRCREVISFIDRLTPGQFPEATDYLRQSHAAPDISKILGLVATAWGRIDPHAALENAQGLETYAALASWASFDPAAAIAWTHERSGMLWDDYSVVVCAAVARQDPGPVLQRLHELSDSDQRADVLSVLQREMNRQEQPAVADRLLDFLTDPAERTAVAKQALRSPDTDPRSNARLLATHPDLQNEEFESFFSQWAARDAAASQSFLAALPSGNFKNQTGAFVALGIASRDPKSGLAMALQYPAGFNDQRLNILVQYAMGCDPPAILGLVEQVAGDRADGIVVSAMRSRVGGLSSPEENRRRLDRMGVPQRLHAAILSSDKSSPKSSE